MSKGIIRISDAASIALRSMAYLAAAGESGAKISDIASAIGASKNHLAKVLALLASEGLVHSERGPSGGVRLARRGCDISLAQVYDAVEANQDERRDDTRPRRRSEGHAQLHEPDAGIEHARQGEPHRRAFHRHAQQGHPGENQRPQKIRHAFDTLAEIEDQLTVVRQIDGVPERDVGVIDDDEMGEENDEQQPHQHRQQGQGPAETVRTEIFKHARSHGYLNQLRVCRALQYDKAADV